MSSHVQIDGIGTVELDDSFKSKSPAEQQAIVEDIANQHAAQTAQPSIGGLAAFGRGADNAFTFGTMPNLVAAADATIPLDRGSSSAPSWSQRYDENLANQRQWDALGQEQHPGASAVGSFVGGIANPVSRAMPAAKTIGGAALQGAGMGAAYGFGSGQGGFENRAKSAMYGAAGGAIAGTALGGLSKGIAGATATPAAQGLEAEGVTPTIGQKLGGGWQRAENSLADLPGVGAPVQARQAEAVNSFNRATYNRALEPLGIQYPQNEPIGNAGIARLSNIFDKAYDQAYSGATVRNDTQLQSDISKALDSASFNLPKERFGLLQKFVDDRLTPSFDQNGEMQANSFQGIKNALAQRSRQLAGSADNDQRDLGQAYGDLLDALKSNIARNDPERGAMLNAADAGYARFVRVAGAAASQGANKNNGVFTPDHLASAVRAYDTSPRKLDFAQGDALMQDMAQNGQATLTPPTSANAGRFKIMSWPAAALAAPASLAYTKRASPVINAMLFGGSPIFRQSLSGLTRSALPGAVGLIGSGLPLSSITP